MNKNKSKLAMLIHKEIALILQFNLKNENIGMVTVTEVTVTADNSYAHVYVTFIDKSKEDISFNALKENEGYIRGELARKISIYKIPKLIFEIDRSRENYEKIEKILKDK